MNTTPTPEFQSFPKMPRFCRDIIVTEKIDGTNGQIFINDDCTTIYAGSRNRWLTPDNDNFGFCRWVWDNADELRKLGPGRHFGEWWGSGIQRGYGLKEKRFSLFNTQRWVDARRSDKGALFTSPNQELCPACCHVVPVLYSGAFEWPELFTLFHQLSKNGSVAAPGFANPEGIVIYHTAAKQCFKKTFVDDAVPKSAHINKTVDDCLKTLAANEPYFKVVYQSTPLDYGP